MAGRRTNVGVKAEAVDTTEEVQAAVDVAPETEEVTAEKKQYTVKAPNPDFCGVGAAGIQFANGQGVINDNGDDDGKTAWVIEWYKSHGYTVE